MKKYLNRIALGAGTVGIIIAGAAAFSAFEAHVINVTAKIENALSVNTEPIDFGTVFPQEYITDKTIIIALSNSFLDTQQDRVKDVSYVIKQKPKVKKVDNINPQGDPYKVITVGQFTGPAWQYCEENLPVDAPHVVNLQDSYWTYCYLPLANYLSKTPQSPDGGDTGVAAFHRAYVWDNNNKSSLNQSYIAKGHLDKSTDPADISDTWVIDLAVPCFTGQCDQGWAAWVNAHNGDNPEEPEYYTLPGGTNGVEHEWFGTDLWVEVTGFSPTPPQPIHVQSNPLSYGPTGWGGWSCPAGTTVVDGSLVVNGGDLAQSFAWKPGATTGTVNYPNTPFGYTYGAGETGYIAQNDNDSGETIILSFDCMPN